MGRPFSVDLSNKRGSSRVRLTVKSARPATRVEDKFKKRRTYRPGAGRRFIVVEYQVKNLGPAEIDGSGVSEVFLLRTTKTTGWARVDRSDDCQILPQSFAELIPGSQSPEVNLRPGAGYATVAAYSVPEHESRLSWFGKAHEIRLRLGDALRTNPG